MKSSEQIFPIVSIIKSNRFRFGFECLFSFPWLLFKFSSEIRNWTMMMNAIMYLINVACVCVGCGWPQTLMLRVTEGSSLNETLFPPIVYRNSTLAWNDSRIFMPIRRNYLMMKARSFQAIQIRMNSIFSSCNLWILRGFGSF